MMKHLARIACVISSLSAGTNSYGSTPLQSPSTYILKISNGKQMAEQAIPAHDFCGFYKGYRLVFHKDMCVINHPSNMDQCVMIITKEALTRSRNNNTQYLERIKNEACKLFYLTRNHQDASWTIQQEKDDSIPCRLPADALVIFMDPSLVEGLYCDTKSSDSNIQYLPSIYLKPGVTPEQLKEASTYSAFASLETDAVPQAHQSTSHKDVLVSLNMCSR